MSVLQIHVNQYKNEFHKRKINIYVLLLNKVDVTAISGCKIYRDCILFALVILLSHGAWFQETVNAIDDPAEQTTVESLSHGVTGIYGLRDGVVPHNQLTPSNHSSGCQGLHKVNRRNSKQT